MPNIGQLTIALDVNAAGYTSGMSNAARVAQKTSGDISNSFTSTNYSMMEARHGVMLLGEEFGIHMPRAVSTMLAAIAPVGNVMAAAFPILGVVALIGILDKAADHFDKVKEAAQAFADKQIEASTKTAIMTQALTLENLKLDDQLAKLEGGKSNKLAEELVAANKAALELADGLDKDIAASEKATKQIGAWETVKLLMERTMSSVAGKGPALFDVGETNKALADAKVRLEDFNSAQQEMNAQPTVERRKELIQAIKDTQGALVKDISALREYGGSTETVEEKIRQFTVTTNTAADALKKYGLEAQKAAKEKELAEGGKYGTYAVKFGQLPLPTSQIPAGAAPGLQAMREETELNKGTVEGWVVLGKLFATTLQNDAEAERELTKEIKAQDEALKESESGYEASIKKEKEMWDFHTKARAAAEASNTGLESKGIIFGAGRGGAGKNPVSDLAVDVEKLGGDFEGVLVKGITSANDELAKFITTGQGSFTSVVKGMEEALVKLAIQFAETQLLGGLFGTSAAATAKTAAGGGNTGFFGSLLGAFGGLRAGGGDVMPGQAYIVGEERPEWFVPDTPGKIVNTPPGGGGGSKPMSVTIHQHIHGVQDPDQFRAAQPQIASEAYRHIRIAHARNGGNA